MKAFYFSNKDRKLQYGDNRIIRTGRTHKVKGEIIPCENGLHASERLIDALQYAPDAILWHVELGGTIVHGGDKVAASERTYLASFDATELLDEFARKQALINIEKIKPYCSEEDYDLIVRYLETGDEDIRKAISVVTDRLARRSMIAAEVSAARSVYWAAHSEPYSAAHASDNFDKHAEEANKMLTEMVREATGWDIHYSVQDHIDLIEETHHTSRLKKIAMAIRMAFKRLIS